MEGAGFPLENSSNERWYSRIVSSRSRTRLLGYLVGASYVVKKLGSLGTVRSRSGWIGRDVSTNRLVQAGASPQGLVGSSPTPSAALDVADDGAKVFAREVRVELTTAALLSRLRVRAVSSARGARDAQRGNHERGREGKA